MIRPKFYNNAIDTRIDSKFNKITGKLALHQNYPNPFNGETRISYSLSNQANVILTIFNLSGQRIITLVNEEKGIGSHEVIWNGRDHAGNVVSSGVYFYRLESMSDTRILTQDRKLILMQ